MTTEALGVGLVYWPGLDPLVEAGVGLVDVVEVEPQAFWLESGDPSKPWRIDDAVLDLIAGLAQPKIVHGVGFPVGGTRSPDPRQLPPLLATIERLRAVWASEHLAFNEVGHGTKTFRTGFMLPPRQTREGVAAAARSIRSVADSLPVPFAVETGVSYLRPRAEEMPDGAFVGEVAEAAGCGILLDLHNIWANEVNGRQPALEFVEQLPLDRVWEVHLAGGFELDGYWLDAHSGVIPPAVVDLAAAVLSRLPNVRALVLEILPEFVPQLGLDGVAGQLGVLRNLWNDRGTVWKAPARKRESAPTSLDTRGTGSPEEWEATLGALAAGVPTDQPFASELSSDPGTRILRKLVSEFRAGMVAEALTATTRLLLLTRGEAWLRGVFEDFWRRSTPQLFASVEAEAFARELGHLRGEIPYLDDVLSIDLALLRARVHGQSTSLRLRWDPATVLGALAAGRLPHEAAAGEHGLEIGPEEGNLSGPSHARHRGIDPVSR